MALTLIPLLCVMFLKVKQEKQSFDSKFYRGYRSALMAAVRHPVITLSITALVSRYLARPGPTLEGL